MARSPSKIRSSPELEREPEALRVDLTSLRLRSGIRVSKSPRSCGGDAVDDRANDSIVFRLGMVCCWTWSTEARDMSNAVVRTTLMYDSFESARRVAGSLNAWIRKNWVDGRRPAPPFGWYVDASGHRRTYSLPDGVKDVWFFAAEVEANGTRENLRESSSIGAAEARAIIDRVRDGLKRYAR